MSLEFRTLQPAEFYHSHLSGGRRPDGRTMQERRPVTVSTGHVSTADGSAVVKSGNTTIVCGVRAEITSPHPDNPDLGFIVPNFSFASSSFSSSGTLHETQRVTQFLLEVLNSSDCINRQDLCIESGERVWVLYVDLVCRDHSGNIFDTSATAMIAALKDTKLPRVTFDSETRELSCS